MDEDSFLFGRKMRVPLGFFYPPTPVLGLSSVSSQASIFSGVLATRSIAPSVRNTTKSWREGCGERKLLVDRKTSERKTYVSRLDAHWI